MHTEINIVGGTTLQQEIAKFIRDNQGVDCVDKLLRKELVKVALVMTRGNQSEAANVLGINRGTLRKVRKGY